jgi:hypothetical protein
MCTVVMEQNTLYTQATGGVERLDFRWTHRIMLYYKCTLTGTLFLLKSSILRSLIKTSTLRSFIFQSGICRFSEVHVFVLIHYLFASSLVCRALICTRRGNVVGEQAKHDGVYEHA